MAVEFQFAFLGPEHSYVASLTKTSSAGIPQDRSSNVEFYGLPQAFCDQYRNRLALPRYMYNIRGHDFLSFVGQWKAPDRDGPFDTNQNIYSELDELQRLATEEEQIFAQSNRKANLIASFGPFSDSFFADAFRLKRYRWRNLPTDLEDEIQKMVCDYRWIREGKGKIWDVAINSEGGWVMQIDEGADWKTGGELPRALKKALEEGKRWKAVSIAKLFLNHQNDTEYVLLLSDGRVYAQLHEAFKVPLRRVLTRWFDAKTRRNRMPEGFEWLNVTASCECSEKEQKMKNAAYYARRGIFHHRRENPLLAHKYLREANEQHPNNSSIQENYVKTLRAVRNFDYDPILEDLLGSEGQLTRQSTGLSGAFHGNDAERQIFRNEYMWVIGKLRRIGSERTEELARLLEGGRTQVNEVFPGTTPGRGWSSAMGTSADLLLVAPGELEGEAEPPECNLIAAEPGELA